MKLSIPLRSILAAAALAATFHAAHAATPIIFPTGTNGVGMIDVTTYGADPTGTNDSTTAIQAAVTANAGLEPTRTLYFPQGKYIVTKTIECKNSAGTAVDRMSFQGAGQGLTTLYVPPNTAFFQGTPPTDPTVQGVQKGVLYLHNLTTDVNGLENNVWDMTIDIDTGNPCATGIDWCCNNLATIRNVTIISRDTANPAYVGIFGDGWPGPALIKNVTVTGFKYGISIRTNELSVTMDQITLSGQTVYGIYNPMNGAYMRNVNSTNAVPALYAGVGSLNVMTGCTLTGTNASVPAVAAQNTTAAIYLRHVTTSGYAALVKGGSTVMQAASIPNGEYSSKPTQRLFNNAEAGLGLDPASEAPEYYDSNLAHWASVTNQAHAAYPDGSGDSTQAIQDAIDSGATTVYFPLGTYLVTGTIHVRGSVVRIFGNQSEINVSAPATYTVSNPMPVFNIENGTSAFILLDRIHLNKSSGVYTFINQATTHQLVLRDSGVGTYLNSVAGGTFYAENIEGFTGTFNGMAAAYAMQLDTEVNYPKIVNNNSNLWMLGFKTERATTNIETKNGGKTEILGGYFFSNWPTYTTPAILNDSGSQFFGSFEQVNSANPNPWKQFFATLVRETEGGVTKNLYAWDATAIVTSYSDNAAAPVHAAPTASISSPTEGQVFSAGSNITINVTASTTTYQIEAVGAFQAQNTAPILSPQNTASITWSSPAPGNYTLYVKATDTSNVVGYSTPVHITVKPNLGVAGTVTEEFWERLSQQWQPSSSDAYVYALVSWLQTLPAYINDKPDAVAYPTSLNATSANNNYNGRFSGVRLHGYIQPPTTGAYTFWISSGDNSALWLNTSSSDPTNVSLKQLIATNDAAVQPNTFNSTNTSASITLTAGVKYYFEAVAAYGQGGQGEHVEVAWQGPGITQQIIPGTYLYPFDPTTAETQPALPANTLLPEADTYARGGGYPNTNYGVSQNLEVAATDGGTSGVKSYLRFDLSGQSGSITKAVLWLYVNQAVAGDSNQVELLTQPDGDAWTETGVNFNNKPGVNPSPFAGPWTPVAGQWVQQDVTALAQSAFSNDPNKKFAIAVVHTGSLNSGLVLYSSKEDLQELAPRLVVTTTASSHTPFVTGQTLGTVNHGHSGGVGFKFTVGSAPITVYSLGRWVVAGNTHTHVLNLIQASNNAVVATTTVNTAGAPAGNYLYADLSSPVVLAANTVYYLFSQEDTSTEQYYYDTTALTTTSAATINEAEEDGTGNRYYPHTAGSYGEGPVNFLYGP